MCVCVGFFCYFGDEKIHTGTLLSILTLEIKGHVLCMCLLFGGAKGEEKA